jgi:hypothetical protein
MSGAAVLKQPAVGKHREKKINDDLKIIEMSESLTYDIHGEGDKHYIVHFVNPTVFGREFAILSKGPNYFTRAKNEETNSYFFDDAQLRKLVTPAEPAQTERIMALATTQAVTPTPCTGPILIPPRMWDT